MMINNLIGITLIIFAIIYSFIHKKQTRAFALTIVLFATLALLKMTQNW